MNTYIHPVSGAEIQGLRLGPGATLADIDSYDSTSGKWERAGRSLSGAVLNLGCTTIWVRPQAELSKEGRVILSYIGEYGFYLARRHGLWLVLPSVESMHDGRIQWELLNQQCGPELVTTGLVQNVPGEEWIYEITQVGRELLIL